MNISLDDNVHATNPIKLDLLVLVLPPVTHADQVSPASVVLLITFCQNSVRVQRCP